MKNQNSEWQFQRQMLEAMLYFSRTDENFMFPRHPPYILSEFVNGVIKYIGGTPKKVFYQKFIGNTAGFEIEMEKYLLSELKKNNGIRSPLIKEAVKEIVKPIYGDGIDCNLYLHFNNICEAGLLSRFSLEERILKKVEKKVIPSLSKAQLDDTKGIGICMRDFIEEDLEFIRKRSYW